MMNLSRLGYTKLRVAYRVGLLIACAAFGGILTYRLGDAVDDRIEKANLMSYAIRVVDRGQQLGKEAGWSIHEILQNGGVPCSDPDLVFIRGIVLASEHLRDAGRMRDGKLECSAVLGRLQPLLTLPKPDVSSDHPQSDSVSGQWNTWNSNWPSMPAGVHSHIIEAHGVWVAINEQTLKGQEEPSPARATELLYDRKNQRMLPSLGPDVPLSLGEVVSGKLIERQSVLYQPLCRPNTIVCAVVSEPLKPLFATNWMILWSRAMLGGLLGILLACLAILLDFKRQSLEAQLRKALFNGELALVYQPIVDLTTERIVGAEALVRWTKPNGDSVSPEVFIPLAEEKRFVGQITRIVLQRVVEEFRDMLATGKLHVTINVTVQDLTDPQFLPHLNRCLHSANIKPSAIGLELTERSTAEPIIATNALLELKQAGYSLYIDDFGTGYSSLGYLHQLSVDGIKVDRMFTKTIGTGSVTASIIPQIIDMAQQLSLQMVIEGIETRQQAEYFRAALPHGLGQGWLYSKPISSVELRRLLQKYPSSSLSATYGFSTQVRDRGFLNNTEESQ